MGGKGSFKGSSKGFGKYYKGFKGSFSAGPKGAALERALAPRPGAGKGFFQKGSSKGLERNQPQISERERSQDRRRPPSRGRAKVKEPTEIEPSKPVRSSSAPGRPKLREPLEAYVPPKRSSSQSSRGPRPGQSRPIKRSWDHPEGKPFEELKEGATVTGVVVNISDYGVFADIGYERNVLVGFPARFWRRFRRGDVLEELVVQSVQLKSDFRRALVALEDPETALEANRNPLEDLQEGSYVNGVIDQVNDYGVFVNIGAEICHGRLKVPGFIARRLLRGQVLRDLLVGHVDIENQRVSLMLDDAEAALENVEMVSMATILGQPDESNPDEAPKPKPQKTEAKQPKVEEELPFKVGELVDGVVKAISTKGIRVEIEGPAETTHTGLLVVSEKLLKEFQRDDRVRGMKVEKINAGTVTLSMDDPELEVENEE